MTFRGQRPIVTVVTLLLLTGIIVDISMNLGGDMPTLPNLSAQVRPEVDASFDDRIRSLFTRSAFDHEKFRSDQSSPFYTKHFIPPKKAPPPKPKPKPKTKKYGITFQGYYTTSNEDQKAFLVVDGDFKSLRVGQRIVDEIVLLSLTPSEIEVGAKDKQRTKIKFRATQTLEVLE